MYPYHNLNIKRIKKGELIAYRFVENYKQIGTCLLLIFRTKPFVRPVRPHQYQKYYDILMQWNRSN